ncbi:BPK_HP2_G0053220.mRNA.1.CDS.1 [Saccharomyces cerevisiae]|nr:BPK_HP2_G0053220.mRNA.1.CDS.1 [Saccharomyces cerevisiae]CAI5338901.1 AIF_HP2_G0054070.mRNA.1.CDS.1 [Saccharomyces cerevisiae]CAI6766727.1 BPK_HP2_G0053220.mRNA.1.CDS.1 [Saccharomyces cerevisiae]CAI6800712.1 BPK_HP1_G0056530.mRNA.1.CDS.1 [Saccharomyces cerevisiae]CAI6812189.1 AIF_HP2_G0054070.mRNA.1.CDS.1 [Saccharomyces cerevisiae]
MDFTSDTTNSHDTSNSHLSLEDAVGTHHAGEADVNIDGDEKQQLSLLDDDQVRALKLQEEKDALLTRRNTLLQEIQTYQNILMKENNSKTRNGDILQNDITQDFLNLISISSSNPNSAISDGNRVERINGLTNLQMELVTKYDTLPLLNMNLRLSYLRDHTYPHLQVSVQSRDRVHNDGIEVLVVNYKFCRNTMNPFEIQFKMFYKFEDSTLLKWEILRISTNVRLKAKQLLATRNFQKCLLSLYEFDKIKSKKTGIFQNLINLLKRKTRCYLMNNSDSLIVERVIREGRLTTIKLQINFIITMPGERGKPRNCFLPMSKISIALWKGGERFNQIDLDEICYGLIKEYGVKTGLKEICNVCLFPDMYAR